MKMMTIKKRLVSNMLGLKDANFGSSSHRMINGGSWSWQL